MKEISISNEISYLEGRENPLSADIGIVRIEGESWLFDVGNGPDMVEGIPEGCNVVLSHFHQDHVGNLELVNAKEVYVSKETEKYVKCGRVVSEDYYAGPVHIFPLPSSHAKGCLGLEINETHAFVGDALYCKGKNGRYYYNAQLLKEEIEVLKKMKAEFLLASHHMGQVRSKQEVLAELEEVYKLRVPGNPEIEVPR